MLPNSREDFDYSDLHWPHFCKTFEFEILELYKKGVKCIFKGHKANVTKEIRP